jgi:hypothetical protein
MKLKFAGIALVVSLLTPSVHASWVITGDPAAQLIRHHNSLFNLAIGRVGERTSGFAGAGARSAEFVFQLPTPPSNTQPIISDAQLQFTITGDQPDGTYSIDLYGLPARPASTVFMTDNYTERASIDTATLIEAAIVPSVHPAGTLPELVRTSVTGSQALVD